MNVRRAWIGIAAGAVLGVALAGCPEKAPVTPPAGADAGAGTAATAPGLDAGPAAAPELAITVTGEAPDGGGTFELPLTEGARPEVPQLQAMTVSTNVALRDFRVRVFDEADKAMVSDDSSEDLGDAGTRYRIAFPQPLKTGFRYTLVLDAQTGPLLEDALGREHPDLRREFKIAGEREKPAPPAKKSTKKRHR